MTRARVALGTALALSALAWPGCTCSWFAPSAKRTAQAGAQQVQLRARAFRKFGVDGIGAPHVGGVLWPTIDGYGLSVALTVGERPEIGILARKTQAMPTDGELAAVISGVELSGSSDGKHIGFKLPENGWHVLHLLPVGAPFHHGEASVPLAGGAVDWSALPAPEAAAIAVLRDRDRSEAASAELVWQAVLAQPPGPPWDDALLEAFPWSEHAREWAAERFAKQPPPSADWRERAAKRAVSALRDPSLEINFTGPKEGEAEFSACVDLVAKLDTPAHYESLDRALLDVWQDADPQRSSKRTQAFRTLTRRLGICEKRPWASGKLGSPISDATRRALVQAGRAQVEKDETAEGIEIVVAVGTDDDRARADDALIAKGLAGDDDVTNSSFLALVARASANPTILCAQKQPPPTPQWRTRLRTKARPALSDSDRRGREAALVLIALGEQPDLDAGLDRLLAGFPEEVVSELIDNVERGSSAFKDRARVKAEKLLAPSKDPNAYVPYEQKGPAAGLLYQLDYETASCERLGELQKAAGGFAHKPMPDRCAKR